MIIKLERLCDGIESGSFGYEKLVVGVGLEPATFWLGPQRAAAVPPGVGRINNLVNLVISFAVYPLHIIRIVGYLLDKVFSGNDRMLQVS